MEIKRNPECEVTRPLTLNELSNVMTRRGRKEILGLSARPATGVLKIEYGYPNTPIGG